MKNTTSKSSLIARETRIERIFGLLNLERIPIEELALRSSKKSVGSGIWFTSIAEAREL